MQDVTIDRDKYIGGSDVPIIMGLSPFETRWELLLDKAGYTENEFEGNEYTEYGRYMEPLIREYINYQMLTDFKEDKRIDGQKRYHADGYDGKCVLEIKTTSQIHKNAEDYKAYMVQLQMGMDMFGTEKGVLAVYERPDDFAEEFDPLRLHVYDIDRDETLVGEIDAAIGAFLTDLEYLKENPLASESDLPSMSPIVPIANDLVVLEAKLEALSEYKELSRQYDELRAKLKVLMTEYDIKSYKAVDGTVFTLVKDGKDKEVDVFDEARFKVDCPRIWESYTTRKIKKGRAGYVRITSPNRD